MTAAPAWPAPADPDAALRLRERFAALGPVHAAFAETPVGTAVLAALGGGSPFLSDLALREPATLIETLRDGPGPALDAVFERLAAVSPQASRSVVAATVRAAKRRAALAIALADIGGTWSVRQVTAALTQLAEATLGLVVRHLLRAAHDAREIALPTPDDPGRDSGFVALGMGKLGAGELNYSSDIDLVLLYDPDRHPDRLDTLAATFTRLARNLVAMMEARDADGYVFRTDLRLRPDPAATPPAMGLPAAIAYYESMGQNWERAAMIKARPVAGDLAVGASFLAAIRPFVWRRSLDFAAIADIHAMKRRIDDHRGFGHRHGAALEQVAGLNVKLGQGGIREIEFAAQTLQLVWGGRDPSLRDPTTLGALRALVRAGRLPRRAAAELTVAYRALRRVEHRVQMVADRQTHALPDKPEELARFAVFMGYLDAPAFADALVQQLERVRRHYAAIFEAVPEGPPVSALDLSGMDMPAGTVASLQAMGFTQAAGMVTTLRGWQAGRIRALRTTRARELMDGVLPELLPALGRQADPDAAFARFDSLLSRLPAGVGLLSMVSRNRVLLERIAAVLGAAPSLADHLAQVPAALEGLLDPAAFDPDPEATLHSRLQDARTLEEVVGITRLLVRTEEFRLCVAQMDGWIDVDQAGIARTALADAALRALLPAVLADHAARNGHVPGGAMVVVALGKAGGAEMMAGSDLDLMLIYDHPETVVASEGARVVASSQWFIRAAHAVIAALTAPGAGGALYEVDMRLRPSGRKGPVAVSLAAFRHYHSESAWTWERMALTRARVVAGDPALAGRVTAAIAAALLEGGEPGPDAAAMRARLLHDLPPAGPWDVKLRPGGAIEVEFVAQVLQLRHGMAPGGQCTRTALAALGTTGHLPEWQALLRADRLWRTVQSMVRITVGRGAMSLPEPALAALLRVADAGVDLPALRATLDREAAIVRAAFIHHVGEPV